MLWDRSTGVAGTVRNNAGARFNAGIVHGLVHTGNVEGALLSTVEGELDTSDRSVHLQIDNLQVDHHLHADHLQIYRSSESFCILTCRSEVLCRICMREGACLTPREIRSTAVRRSCSSLYMAPRRAT